MHARVVPVGRGSQRPLPQQRRGPGHRQRQVSLGWARAGALTPDPNAHLNPNPNPNPSPSSSPNPNPHQVHCERTECTEAVWASQASNGYGTCGAQIEWVQANIPGMGELTAACTYVGQQASTSS